MSPEPEPGISVKRCEQIARAASLLAIGIGLLVLAGWCFDFRPLMTVLPGLVSMKPNTAIAFCLAGLSLFLFLPPAPGQTRRWRQISPACAFAVSVLGTLALLEYATGWNLGVDELLFRDPVSSGTPGRMSPISAFNFVCLGLALALIHFPRRTALGQALITCVASTSLLAVVGYSYGAASLYQSDRFTAIALHTAIAFLALCSGVWFATSRHGFMQVITGSGRSGIMARTFGVAAVLMPLLFGWLRLQGGRLGWYGTEFGVAIVAVVTVATFVALVRIGAGSLRAAECNQACVQESLLEMHRDLEQRVLDRTAELAKANADLHEQMRERSLVEHTNQQILDNSLDIICTIDVAGRFLQVSRACELVWGYRPEELVGRPFLDLVHPDDHEKTIAVDARIMDGEVENGFENRYMRPDGSAVPMVWTANWSEEHQMNFCVARDVTVRKRMESELRLAKEAAEEASRMKSEFMANMSHEIRTPMNGIMGMTELVLDTELDREQREYLGMAQTSAHALLALINDILDFSKIEAGKLELEAIPFSLQECVETTLKPLGLRAREKGIELTSDIAAEVLDDLIGDPLRLRQILINLVDNAIKFTERGSVKLRVAVESDPLNCPHDTAPFRKASNLNFQRSTFP